MINIVKMHGLCFACPSSWEGWDEEGTYYYFRFRWGFLQATTKTDWQSPIALAFGAQPNDRNETIYGEQISDEFDGMMSYEDLQECLAIEFTFPETTTPKEQEAS
jgi:hypothetical protein